MRCLGFVLNSFWGNYHSDWGEGEHKQEKHDLLKFEGQLLIL